MKSVTAKIKFSWKLYFLLTLGYFIFTPITDKIFDSVQWNELLLWNNLLKNLFTALVFGFVITILLRPQDKKD